MSHWESGVHDALGTTESAIPTINAIMGLSFEGLGPAIWALAADANRTMPPSVLLEADFSEACLHAV